MNPNMQIAARSKKLLRILANKDYRRGLRLGMGAGVEHEWLLRELKCKTVVDIGANRGQFSLAVRGSTPQAQIIAFEPLSAPASVFRRLFISDPRVTFHQIAIGAQREEATINVSKEDDSSSLLPIGALQSRLFPSTSPIGIERVQVERLDAILYPSDLKSPSLLKIDVQGYELAVLDGCGGLLSSFDFVYVECSFVELYAGQPLAHQVITCLEQRDFQLRGVFNPAYDKRELAVQGDFLFLRGRGAKRTDKG